MWQKKIGDNNLPVFSLFPASILPDFKEESKPKRRKKSEPKTQTTMNEARTGARHSV